MAVLPGPESVGPAPDVIPRLGGVGHWDPRIISEATQQAGRGFDTLGRDITDAAAQQQERTNQLQMAQARGAVYAATTAAQAKMPTLTNPDMIQDAQQDLGDTVNGAVAGVSDPRNRAMLSAELMPHLAEVGARYAEHGINLDNQNQIANFEQNTNATINNLATMDDDAASQRGLGAVKANIQHLVDGGAINPIQGQTRAQQAAEQYIDARHTYLYEQAKRVGDQSGVYDWSRLENFIRSNE